MEDKIKKIKEGLKFPYVNLRLGSLGGNGLYILVSFDKEGDWINGIVENSRYLRLCVDEKIEHFAGCGVKNFRKCKYKDVDDLIRKLNKYYDDNDK